MLRSVHVPRILLAAAVLAVVSGAAIDSRSSAKAATTPCGPLGTLTTYQLNDRCNYGLLDLSLLTDALAVHALDGIGVFATLTNCTDQWLSSVPVLAMPDELLVTAS